MEVSGVTDSVEDGKCLGGKKKRNLCITGVSGNDIPHTISYLFIYLFIW
jgi:hypothetical protein